VEDRGELSHRSDGYNNGLLHFFGAVVQLPARVLDGPVLLPEQMTRILQSNFVEAD
jgi:hypothetical protein